MKSQHGAMAARQWRINNEAQSANGVMWRNVYYLAIRNEIQWQHQQ